MRLMYHSEMKSYVIINNKTIARITWREGYYNGYDGFSGIFFELISEIVCGFCFGSVIWLDQMDIEPQLELIYEFKNTAGLKDHFAELLI